MAAHDDVSSYSVLERVLLPAKGLSAEVPFVLFNDNDKEHQIFLALFKTALFDEKMFQQDSFFMTAGSIMLLLFELIAVISVICLFVFLIVDIRRGTYRYEAAAMMVLFLTEMVSYVSFCLKYKAVSSMNMRYVVPVVIPLAYMLARLISALNRRRKEEGIKGILVKTALYGISALVVLFSILTLLFYGSYWLYFVKTGAAV